MNLIGHEGGTERVIVVGRYTPAIGGWGFWWLYVKIFEFRLSISQGPPKPKPHLLSHPEDFPPAFKRWLLDFLDVNRP